MFKRTSRRLFGDNIFLLYVEPLLSVGQVLDQGI